MEQDTGTLVELCGVPHFTLPRLRIPFRRRIVAEGAPQAGLQQTGENTCRGGS